MVLKYFCLHASPFYLLVSKGGLKIMARVMLMGGTSSQRLLYGFHLKHLRCELTAFERYNDALTSLQESGSFDVIFISAIFPFKKELDFIPEVQRLFPRMPIVVMAQLEVEHMAFISPIHTHATVFMFAPATKFDFEKVLKQLGLL
jgi:DNA-binding NtrC family response regulator